MRCAAVLPLVQIVFQSTIVSSAQVTIESGGSIILENGAGGGGAGEHRLAAVEEAIRTLQAEVGYIREHIGLVPPSMPPPAPPPRSPCTASQFTSGRTWSSGATFAPAAGWNTNQGAHLAFDSALNTYAQTQAGGELKVVFDPPLDCITSAEFYLTISNNHDSYATTLSDGTTTAAPVGGILSDLIGQAQGGWVSIPVPSSGIVSLLTIDGETSNLYDYPFLQAVRFNGVQLVDGA